ncbi:hypothetical protein KIV65_gp21 [Mycobacterium phage Anthony]|uniref:Uncharacterized protein n=1 Tax=Mycobacterium phage Anthony TaxID=2599857 RepID=A0A5J6TIM4_9CAUD|nr:hypothetical protein KIV65_gp21 [Mycobacterium phage Anthony]QFG10446.1 hypothetical protein PBI_ANTHONY_76 [Mycobacterium phage Anthony]
MDLDQLRQRRDELSAALKSGMFQGADAQGIWAHIMVITCEIAELEA